MSVLTHLQSAIETFEYPHSREVFEQWKHETLAILKPPDGNGSQSHGKLSPRETEVMTMLLEGRRLKEIAARLDISVKTVTTHRARLLRKLHLEDNLGLYRYGIRNGLITA